MQGESGVTGRGPGRVVGVGLRHLWPYVVLLLNKEQVEGRETVYINVDSILTVCRN